MDEDIYCTSFFVVSHEDGLVALDVFVSWCQTQAVQPKGQQCGTVGVGVLGTTLRKSLPPMTGSK